MYLVDSQSSWGTAVVMLYPDTLTLTFLNARLRAKNPHPYTNVFTVLLIPICVGVHIYLGIQN